MTSKQRKRKSRARNRRRDMKRKHRLNFDARLWRNRERIQELVDQHADELRMLE